MCIRDRREGDRLRALQVGVAGQDGVEVLPGLFAEHPDELTQLPLQGRDLVAQIEAQVHRHLVVAAARGVQPLARVADPRGELGLDEHVDVLGLGVERQLSALDVMKDPLEPLNDRLAVLLCNHPALGEHGRVGDRPADVLPVHPAVERDGGIEVVQPLVRLLRKPACP